MKRVVTFANARSGQTTNARVIIPPAFLEIMGVTEKERDINITMEGKKLIIEKLEKEQTEDI